MKTLYCSIIIVLFSANALAEKLSAEEKRHQSIYTQKVRRIVNAINVGDFATEATYLEMLKTACQRNACNPTEQQTVQMVGQQFVQCRLEHLKFHQVVNSDAMAICGSQQAMLGCDTLSTPLLRKMCYTGNKYSLQVWQKKEKRLKSRMPASAPKK